MLNFSLYVLGVGATADWYKPETRGAVGWLVPLFFPIGIPVVLIRRIF